MEIKPDNSQTENIGVEFTGPQKEAIEHEIGPLQIIACAGSGKTEIVSQRIAKLIEKGALPKEIVGFTFTEKAAEELKARVRKILDKKCPERSDLGDMFLGTIHAFCFQKLKELEPSYKSYDLLDDAMRVAFVSKPDVFYNDLKLPALRKYSKGSNPLSKYGVIYRFLYSLDIMRMEGIDPAKLKNKDFRNSFLAYETLLKKEKYLDFSSMISELVYLLEHNYKKCKELDLGIKHLIVDEYQDVNFLQEKLIKLISEVCDSLCVVGDDDQCIYQWRGSQVKNIIEFENRYSSKKMPVKLIPLEFNFRSTEGIIHTARSFIKKNKYRLEKGMKINPNSLMNYEEGDIVHRHFKKESDELNFIIKKIKELNGTDFVDKQNRKFSLTYGDFAILVRTNEDAAKIVPYLEQNKIDFILVGGRSAFERPEIVLALDCISFIFDFPSYSSEKLLTPDELEKSYKQVFIKSKYKGTDSKKFIKKLGVIKKQIDNLKQKKGKKDYLKDGLQPYYHLILNAFGAEDFEFDETLSFNLAVLSQVVSDYESVWRRLRASEIKYFFGFVHAFAEGHYTETAHNDPTLINTAVKVLTIHKAKGLQFPVVFHPCMIKKGSPPPSISFVDENLYDIKKYQGNLEDERRVFYVAMTRSEKYLFITGSEEREGRQKKYSPHDFVNELDQKYITNKLETKRKSSGYPIRQNVQAFYPTSFSELSCFDRCPYDFKFRNIFGYNAGVPAAFGYGANIHNILNVIHAKYKKKVPSLKEIKDLFDKLFHLRYATEKIAENMKNAGIKIVGNYVDVHGKEFRLILETEKKWEFVLNDSIISGEIDLLKKIDPETQKVTDVEIIDFKTEKDGAYTRDYEKQLRLYAIACLKALGLTPKRAYVHHLDTGKKSDPVDISEAKLTDTKNEIAQQIMAILSKKYPANPSKRCYDCDWVKVCSRKDFKYKDKSLLSAY